MIGDPDPDPTTATEDWSFRTPVDELLTATWVKWLGAPPAPLAVHEANNRAHAQLLATVSVGAVPGEEGEARAGDNEAELPVISKGTPADALLITQLAMTFAERQPLTFFESVTVTLHPGGLRWCRLRALSAQLTLIKCR